MVPPPSYLPGRSMAQFPLMMERPERLRKAVEKDETVLGEPGCAGQAAGPAAARSAVRFVLMTHCEPGAGLSPGAREAPRAPLWAQSRPQPTSTPPALGLGLERKGGSGQERRMWKMRGRRKLEQEHKREGEGEGEQEGKRLGELKDVSPWSSAEVVQFI